MNKQRLSFLIFSTLFILSCAKHKARKLSGDYEGVVEYNYFDIGGTTIDTSYTEILTVKNESTTLKVEGNSVNVSELQKNEFVKIGDIHSNFQIMFIKDSVYYVAYNGGLGGNSTYQFSGKKID